MTFAAAVVLFRFTPSLSSASVVYTRTHTHWVFEEEKKKKEEEENAVAATFPLLPLSLPAP